MKTSYILGIVVAVIAAAALSVYGYLSSLRTHGVFEEQALSAAFESEQNERTNMVSTLMEQRSFAAYKTDKVLELVDAYVAGRYGEGGFSSDGAFFAAVAEAAPNTDGLDIWDSFMGSVRGLREAYKEKQNQRLDRARAYNSWLAAGLVRPSVLQSLGFPSENLYVYINGEKKTGLDAVSHMTQSIRSSETVDAYAAGSAEPVDYMGGAGAEGR